MSTNRNTPAIEELLEHADWVRGHARRLVLDSAGAEDLIQETWVQALGRPAHLS